MVEPGRYKHFRGGEYRVLLRWLRDHYGPDAEKAIPHCYEIAQTYDDDLPRRTVSMAEKFLLVIKEPGQ